MLYYRCKEKGDYGSHNSKTEVSQMGFIPAEKQTEGKVVGKYYMEDDKGKERGIDLTNYTNFDLMVKELGQSKVVELVNKASDVIAQGKASGLKNTSTRDAQKKAVEAAAQDPAAAALLKKLGLIK